MKNVNTIRLHARFSEILVISSHNPKTLGKLQSSVKVSVRFSPYDRDIYIMASSIIVSPRGHFSERKTHSVRRLMAKRALRVGCRNLGFRYKL